MTTTDPPAPAATKPKPKAVGTAYVVLSERGDQWALVGWITARSATEAIRGAFTDDNKDATGRYVAIPERSFQPVRVKVETVQRIKLEDAQ